MKRASLPLLRRRDFITLLGGAAAWPIAARAQQPALPAVGYLSNGGPDLSGKNLTAFRQGLAEAGYFEGRNIAIEYRWTNNQADRLTEFATDLVRRRVTLIAAVGAPAAIAAKAATATIPVLFLVGQSPVELGLVRSLARPGTNLTGVNFFTAEVVTKRLGIMHELIPKAVYIAVLVNPSNVPTAEATLRDVQKASSAMGLKIRQVSARTSREIEAAFGILGSERPDALFVAPDGFFTTRRVQFATLAAIERIPASYGQREYAEVGGLMSYGADVPDSFRQLAGYVGNIFKGATPADLPVQQSVKFELVINAQTARALNIEVPPTLLALATEVIE
jgi:putative ABC transport system substrate-binding protein